MSEAENVRLAWGRVAGWLGRNAPGSAAALGGPASPKAISDAEVRLGVGFPQEMWTWLLMNDGVRTREDAHGGRLPVAGGSFLPAGWHLLSVEQIVAVSEWRKDMAEMEPAPDPDRETLGWHRDWVPFAVETDWLYGAFVDTGTGMPGEWSDGDLNRFGTHDSLAEYFHALADAMRQYAGAEDGLLVWR